MPDLTPQPGSIALTKAPESKVTKAEISEPYKDLAAALDKTGDALNTASIQLADRAGITAVTRDPNTGELKVDKAPIVGDAAIAYARGVKIAALAEGEGEARRRDIELRTRFRNDPAGYEAAATAFKDSMVKKYSDAAGPHVGVALGRAIDQTTTVTYRGLLNEKERLDLHSAKTRIETEIEFATNELTALANGGDTSSPEYKQLLGKVGTLYGELMRNPRLAVPRAEVEYKLTNLKSQLDVAAMDHTIGKIHTEKGLEAAIAEADRVKTDPRLNLTRAERLNAYSRLMTGIQQREREAAAVDTSVSKEIDALRKRGEEGFGVEPGRRAQVRSAVEATRNPVLREQLRTAEVVTDILSEWRKLNPAQIEAALAANNELMRQEGPTDARVALKHSGEQLLATMRTQLKNDPLTWVNGTGAIAIPGIDFSKPQTLTDRAARAELAAREYNLGEVSYLKPDERRVLTAAMTKGGDDFVAVAAAIHAGFGPAAPKVMAEIAKDAPAVGHLGNLAVTGGSPAFIRDAADTARRRQEEGYKPESNGAALREQDKRFVSNVGPAFIMMPDTEGAVRSAVRDAWNTRIRRNSLDPAMPDSAYDKTVQEALGATYDGSSRRFGGVDDYFAPGWWFGSRKVLIPSNVRAGEGGFGGFRDIINALKPEDVAGAVQTDGKPYAMSQFRNATPVAVPGGYRFALGEPDGDNPKWIRGKDGKPFTLDLGAMEPEMRKRVPDAYVGGREKHSSLGDTLSNALAYLNPISAAHAEDAWWHKRSSESHEEWDKRTGPVQKQMAPLARDYAEKIGRPTEQWRGSDVWAFQNSPEVRRVLDAAKAAERGR